MQDPFDEDMLAHRLQEFLLERGMPGITTKQMDCMGVWASGTAYVTFEDVKVSLPPPDPCDCAAPHRARMRTRLTDANAMMIRSRSRT